MQHITKYWKKKCVFPREVMYAYMICRPYISYAVTTLSKFSCDPSEYHYKLLKMVDKYLRTTLYWEIIFNRKKPMKLTAKDYQNGFFHHNFS